jgi:hypothetical protein
MAGATKEQVNHLLLIWIWKRGKIMKHCQQCKKVLFKRRDGKLVCPNGCKEHIGRLAFNTVIDEDLNRRGPDDTFDPWASAR